MMKQIKLSLILLCLGYIPLFAQEFDPSSVRSIDCKPGKFSCGYLPAPKEIQDSIPLKRDFNSFEDLPASIDLSSKMPPVGNQGQQNSCVAWASGYAIKSYLVKNGGQISEYDPPFAGGKGQNVFSPAFIYNQQNGGKDQGLYYYKTMEFLQKSGVAPWSSMPYSDKDFLSQPSQTVKEEGLKYKIKSYSRLNMKSPDDLKRVLASGNVVLFGIIIDDAFYKLKGAEVYDQNGGKSYGGHAMTIVGYDDSKKSKSGRKGAFKIQNSWGTYWGDKGYGWISYHMMAKVGQEAYSMIDEKKTPPTNNSSSTDVSITPTITPLKPTDLYPPSQIQVSRGEFPNKIILTWNTVDKALVYLLQRLEDSGNYENLAYSETSTFTDYSVTPNTNYRYRIISMSSEQISNPSIELEGFTSAKVINGGRLEKVVGITGKSLIDKGQNKVYLQWSEVDGAKAYIVAKSTSGNSWKNLGLIKGTNFTDATPVQASNNVYRIAAAIGNKQAGDWSDSIGVFVGKENFAPTQVTDLRASFGDYADKVQLSWSQSPGATVYYLYRFDQDAEPSGQFEVTGTNFEDTDPILKTKPYFIYTVISANDVSYAEPSEVALGKVNPEIAKRGGGATLPAPTNLTHSLNKKESKITLKWSAVKDSHEYYIYRTLRNTNDLSKKSKLEFINSVPGNQTNYSEAYIGKPGQLVMYSVRSKSEFGSESKDSNIITVFINPEKPAIKKRALSLEEIPAKFLGTWTAFHWHPKFGPQELELSLSGSYQNFAGTLKVNGKPTKDFKGDWIPGSSGLRTDGLHLELSSQLEGTSVVKFSNLNSIEQGAEISFSKD
ncbi:MAG: cysteine protease [Leptospira sp.]|nr:cysteine protease [Leptospira sp.]